MPSANTRQCLAGRPASLPTGQAFLIQKNNVLPDAFLKYLEGHLPDPKKHRLYFDYGTETLDALYPPLQKKADAIIKAKGYTDANWITKEFTGADHSERSWNERLHFPLEFLLQK
jgi:hypothetical protein